MPSEPPMLDFRDQCGVRLEKSGFDLALPLARSSLLEAIQALFQLWRPSPSGRILDEQTDQNRDLRPAPPRRVTSLLIARRLQIFGADTQCQSLTRESRQRPFK